MRLFQATTSISPELTKYISLVLCVLSRARQQKNIKEKERRRAKKKKHFLFCSCLHIHNTIPFVISAKGLFLLFCTQYSIRYIEKDSMSYKYICMRIFQVDLHVFVLHRVHIYFNRIELCTEAAQWLYEFFSGFFIILLVFFSSNMQWSTKQINQKKYNLKFSKISFLIFSKS